MKVRVVWKPGGLLGPQRGTLADAPPRALVDVGSHILWGLDDGPVDIEESLALLKIAADHGTTDIVATPRVSLEYPFDPGRIAQRVEELRSRSEGSIRIHTGCEFHFALGNIRDALAHPHKYTINGLNYLLIEFSDVLVPPGTEDILSKLKEKGIVPVIAHPERNPILQRSTGRLQKWVSMGCVLQVTARSISGHFGKIEQRSAWELLREDMVHVIASDARNTLHSPPRLDAAWRLVKHELGEDVARRLLIDHPSEIVQGGAARRKPSAPSALHRTAALGS